MNTIRNKTVLWTVALIAAWGLARPPAGVAQDDGQENQKNKTQKNQIAPTTVVTNLDNPCGVAVHPETGHVFIASRVAVYRFVPTQGKEYYGKIDFEVVGYPTDVYGKGPKYNIGPLGLDFLDNEHLVVGGGSRPDGEELLHVYKIGQKPPEKPKKERKGAVHEVGPIGPSDQTQEGEGNFYGVAVGNGAVFVTTNGDDTKGWIARSAIKDGKPGELKLTIPTKVRTAEALGTGVDAPGPAVFSPDGELVVGQKGEINVPEDSLLTIYDPKSGELKQALQTRLNDIVGLAYSPKTGNLYCTDFSWMAPERGALYRLDIEGDQAKATKIVDLDKPTALDFSQDGTLYLAVFGSQTKEDKENDRSPGKLLRIPAEAGL